MAIQRKINIQNKKARFEFEILDKYTAGIQLTGTEIKSIRESKARITESFCEFNDRGELFIVNMYIESVTSGNSKNVVNAIKLGSKLGCASIGLSGENSSKMNEICEVNLAVSSSDTPRIQEVHIIIGHTICHLIDQEFSH